ncbi:MAG: pantetheine-phosphate adenylyltransferase [Ruminococcaceae bacterium]|nr:pantetheine-phosphate adenylyltransferase [Oscillospiraceae bacterium]
MTAIVTGTFDPITLGHMEVIKKASATFDKVTVLLCQNFDKVNLFPPDTRLEMIKVSVEDFCNVQVEYHEGWLYEYLKKQKDVVLFRGVRNFEDFEYEKNMADFNLEHSGVETLFAFAKGETKDLSSTFVRDLISNKKDFEKYLPPKALEIAKKYLEKHN